MQCDGTAGHYALLLQVLVTMLSVQGNDVILLVALLCTINLANMLLAHYDVYCILVSEVLRKPSGWERI